MIWNGKGAEKRQARTVLIVRQMMPCWFPFHGCRQGCYAVICQQTLQILELRRRALEIFESIEDELETLEDIYAGLELKLRTLETYDSIYRRPSYDQVKAGTILSSIDSKRTQGRVKEIQEIRRMMEANRNAVTNSKRKHDVTLAATVFLVTGILTLPLGYQAWAHSSQSRGSTSDADLWLLISEFVHGTPRAFCHDATILSEDFLLCSLLDVGVYHSWSNVRYRCYPTICSCPDKVERPRFVHGIFRTGFCSFAIDAFRGAYYSS